MPLESITPGELSRAENILNVWLAEAVNIVLVLRKVV